MLLLILLIIIIFVLVFVLYRLRKSVEEMTTDKNINQQMTNNINSQLNELYILLKQYKPTDPQYDAIIKQIKNLQIDIDAINNTYKN